MSEPTAVVLFNLGGPDSLESVEPFLYRLFADPDIVKLPFAFVTQRLFARIASRRRAPAARAAYTALGGKSPLLENTRRQALALEQALAGAGSYEVHVCMRYWHPLTEETVAELKRRDRRRVILLPLYPQYSITTTGSACHEFLRQCRRLDYAPSLSLVRDWYRNETYQRAIVQSIQAAAAALPDPRPESIHLLFSAHGLPQKIIDSGDVYEQQVRATYEALRARLGWPHTTLCYQSRVGPLKWLQPYTQQVIRDLGAAGTRQVLVYPIAFVSDHSETLFELGIDYAKLASESGILDYRVVPALNDDPLLVRALKEEVLKAPPPSYASNPLTAGNSP